MRRPIVAITMGDPAGVGPEVVVKAMGDEEIRQWARLLVVGDAGRLKEAVRLVGSDLEVRMVGSQAEVQDTAGTIDCIQVGQLPANLPWGKLSAAAGHSAYLYIEKAVTLAAAGTIDAICTAPISKAALHAAGHAFPGHTELLAELTGTDEVSMMLTAPGLRVIHVTTHIGLVDAVARIDGPLVHRTIRRGYEVLRRMGIDRPRIGVCGINPHAGEDGLFGYGEEESKIRPGIASAAAEGIDAVGPLPADTLFFRAARGEFDLVVAMYHDQGHAPVKVLGIQSGVNITVGLPIVRTSVDHGTAFDIAGCNLADHEPMLEALRQAVELTGTRNSSRG